MTRGDKIRAARRAERNEFIKELAWGAFGALAFYGFMHVMLAISVAYNLG